MRLIASELLAAISGHHAHHDRFKCEVKEN